MKQKLELINEIRAMQSNPVARQKLVDLSEVAGYGFLCEMSIIEVSR